MSRDENETSHAVQGGIRGTSGLVLAVLPFSVVFAQRKENRVTVLPYDIPQPDRSLGILRRMTGARSRAAERLAAYVTAAFEDLKHIIKRHESAVVWGAVTGTSRKRVAAPRDEAANVASRSN